MNLTQKVVMVSGIGPGLGIKLAVEAARAGAQALALGARTSQRLDEARAAIAEVAPDCMVMTHRTDITDASHCQAFADATQRQFGRIDALINNAFVHGAMDYAHNATLDDWPQVFNTNLLGTLKMSQAVLPAMRTSGGGAIVMINTMATRQVPPLGEAGYASSKAALATAAKYLASEVAPDNIRVNTVHIGWMWGAPLQSYFEWQAQQHGVALETLTKQVADQIPLRRIPTDDECARAALFLASDDASAITGAALDVNGGAYMP